MADLAKELTDLLNRHSGDSASNVSECVLADYLQSCLKAFRQAMQRDEQPILQIWNCKIGEVPGSRLLPGSDFLMRQAVESAYRQQTGQEPNFCFSGWNGELTEAERKVANEDRG